MSKDNLYIVRLTRDELAVLFAETVGALKQAKDNGDIDTAIILKKIIAKLTKEIERE